jgi:DNA mismatch repair protein MLH1
MHTTKQNLDESIAKENSQTNSPKIVYPYQLTRVDSRERKLDSYLHSNASLNESSFRSNKENSFNEANKKQLTPAQQETNLMKSPLRNHSLVRTFDFASLNELRALVETKSNINVRKIFMEMSFVGIIERELALIQYKTDLFLTNTKKLSQELMYQICLFNFGNFGYYRLQEPISLIDLAIMALDNPLAEWTPEDGPKEKLSSRCAKFLYSKADMLDDYFSIKITKLQSESDGLDKFYLQCLPILIENYEPDLNDLPLFIIRLATEVNWKNERECFDSICKQIAYFYSLKNKTVNEDSASSSQTLNKSKPNDEWIIEHVIYNAFRNMLLISENEEKIFLKLVDLTRLYRVFERC